MPFVHLHNHTDYSFLDGAAKISRYIEKAKSCGMKSLAITDHGNMFGALDFYFACRAANINPILGCEFYMNPHDRREKGPTSDGRRYYHLILLAMNEAGYHNLIKLNSIAFTEGFWSKPRIDDEVLEKYNENIICLSACVAGEIPQTLLSGRYDEAKERVLWFKSVFGDRYYLEIQDHGLEEEKKINPLLQKLSLECDVPLACTNDIHYIEKSDWNAHDTLLCIGTGAKKSDSNRLRYKQGEFYFRTPEEMEKLFSWCPEAVENTGKIAERCHIEIHFPGPKLPRYEIPDGFESPASYLTHLAKEGLAERYATVTPELTERLEYELGVIIKMDFPAYFLIVRDYVHWAKSHGVPVGPGRGSGAGSLVAYSIGITNVDPIKYGLLFERFLNEERISLPDFDIDFCFEGRKSVIDYVTEKYGDDKVGQITTFMTLKAKAVVKDVARVLEIPFAEAGEIASLIPQDPKMTLEKAFEMEKRLGEIEAKGGVYKELFETARILEGMNRNTSLHAAGIVIGHDRLDEYVPVYVDSKTGSLATQYTMGYLEDCGLVKMDFLGLKTLTLIKHTVELIHDRNPEFDIEKIPLDDVKTFNMLSKGDSACVFQFESEGMSAILKREKPQTVEELFALNALYRPGPMDHIGEYIDAKLGKTKIKYPDPRLEDLLKETYGVIIYQEQVMKVAQIVAGYSLGQADILRRIMGKKKDYLLPPELEKFKSGAIKNGYSEKKATDIFNLLVPFAHYGFNKSHAVAYSILAYQTAYLKANYLTEFLAANLTNEMGNPDNFAKYLGLAPKYGIKILPPSINKSQTLFAVSGNNLMYGFAGIKGIGRAVSDEIVRERELNGPYESFIDFVCRQSEGSLNAKGYESLILTGVFDELGIDSATLLANLEPALKFAKKQSNDRAYGQLSLFGDDDEFKPEFKMIMTDPFSLDEKLDNEKELLGYYISGNPLDKYRKEIERTVRIDFSKPENLATGRKFSVIALVNTERVYLTKRQEKMASYTIETYDSAFEAVAFPKVYEQIRDLVKVNSVFAFKGSFTKRFADSPLSFSIDSVSRPEDVESVGISMLHIELTQGEISDDELRNLSSVLKKHSGSTPVEFTFADIPGEALRSDYRMGITYSEKMAEDLKKVDIVSQVWIS